MNAAEIIAKIDELQSAAENHVEQAIRCLKDADEFMRDLKVLVHKSRFVCGSNPWKIEHRATGIVPGNRDWLLPDRDVVVIQD